MAYTKKTWGTYKYDESKSLAENIEAAKTANALITTDDMNRIEQGITDKAEKGEKGDPGTPGKDAKQIKSGVINEDKNGIVTGITVTFTDDTTVDFSVNKATE